MILRVNCRRQVISISAPSIVPLTGQISTLAMSRLVGETGKVVLADINESMLKMGREKLRNIGVIGNVEYVQANAEALPFPDNTFDCITISFGLRNVTATTFITLLSTDTHCWNYRSWARTKMTWQNRTSNS